MLGFTLMGRSHVHRGSQSWQYQILSMIVGYIQFLKYYSIMYCLSIFIADLLIEI
jgi:hypothetical protein